jgi:hypothetical protein
MLKTGALSPDVARAALDALEHKRRKIAAAIAAPARRIEAFPLVAERYRGAVRTLSKQFGHSEQSPEARTLESKGDAWRLGDCVCRRRQSRRAIRDCWLTRAGR